MNLNNQIPLSVLLLGWAGVLPFAGLALAVAFGFPLPFVQPESLLIGYGAVILSFMGGVHWGLAMQSATPDGTVAAAWHYAFSVIPALIAWAAVALAPSLALIVLAAAFLVLLGFDVAWTSGRAAPRWYGQLRIQLTTAVVLCLGLAWTAV